MYPVLRECWSKKWNDTICRIVVFLGTKLRVRSVDVGIFEIQFLGVSILRRTRSE